MTAADFINQTTGAYSFANGTPADIHCLAFYNPVTQGIPEPLPSSARSNIPGEGPPTVNANDGAMDQAILFTLAHG